MRVRSIELKQMDVINSASISIEFIINEGTEDEVLISRSIEDFNADIVDEVQWEEIGNKVLSELDKAESICEGEA